jgi:hypothetical protein
MAWELDAQDYLNSTGDASTRTRLVIIVLVVATFLIFAAVLNSQQTNWMHGRIANLEKLDSPYTGLKVGSFPTRASYQNDEDYQAAIALYRSRYDALWGAVVRTYIDNSWVVRVPFFGFSFDINDIGFLGGLGFLIILTCLRFCLTREIDNLRLAFAEARRIGKLDEFYQLLAMRQVFTVPPNSSIKRTRLLIYVPKLIPWFSVLVYLVLVFNDAHTGPIGREIQPQRFTYLMAFEYPAVILITILATTVTSRLIRMDEMWHGAWEELVGSRTSDSLPQTAIPNSGITERTMSRDLP